MRLPVLVVALLSACNLGTYDPDGGDGGGGGSATRYHPTDFALPDVHGRELTLGLQQCQSCHGDDLRGAGTAVSCDSCHTPAEPEAWRSDCTFCHGGELDDTGAPPRNLDGTFEANAGTFPAHVAHVNPGSASPGFDCVQCHVKADDVLSLGHVFDDTPGLAEVDLAGGLSGLATYDREVGCQNTYCHGDGRGDNGTVLPTAAAMTCAGCHPDGTSDASAWDDMSGSHALHLGLAGEDCGGCHNQTSADGQTIADMSMHIDGLREVTIAEADPGFTFDADTMTCTGTCHGRDHQALVWVRANGRFHPDNYAEADAHGPEMELQRMNCRGCHGDDLNGRGNAPSCDDCHDPNDPTAWRSDCVFCHGGDETDGGAPPRDLGAGVAAASLSFRAHTVHVTQGVASANDCSVCHTKPTDVLSPGHAFDGTPQVAEVAFSGLANGASYAAGGTCSNLYCHGNGRNNGTITDGSPARTCKSCHPDMTSGSNAWETMSGDHKKHLTHNMNCSDCHQQVTANATSIANPALHVNGSREIRFSDANITWDPANGRCNGRCHGENHENERW